VLTPFSYAFAQRGLVEVLLLSVGAGLLGTWIVARGLAFYSHAVAAAAFPGLVLAAGIGFAPMLGALTTGAAFALGVGRLSTRRGEANDSLTALALVGALAAGVVLASNVFHSGSEVDTLLFGSLFALRTSDLVLGLAVSVAALAATLALGPRWLASGFDPVAARAAGVAARWTDLALLALVALAAVAALAAVGSLLATALLVVPAVTARLWARRMLGWQLATVALAATEGVAGIWLSIKTNAPPGAAIAVLGGAVFAFALGMRLVLDMIGPKPDWRSLTRVRPLRNSPALRRRRGGGMRRH
jgi:ABC-type Mn2+/Zn2+ transport system permease subunit